MQVFFSYYICATIADIHFWCHHSVQDMMNQNCAKRLQ